MRFPISTLPIILLTITTSAAPTLTPQFTSVEETVQVADGNQNVGNEGQNSGNSAANKGKVAGDYTVEQGVQTCGSAQLNCCNKIEKQGDITSAGLLGSLFGSGDVGIQCSPINAPVGAALQVPINKVCDAKAACCQGETSQNGLVNLGCTAIPSLV